MDTKSRRIEWIDVFKGLAIILVVIGHSTGRFNAYIYQFHVAAFFFISGWVAKLDNTGLFKDLYKKIMTLLVPLTTMVFVFGVITNVMNICGVYGYFFEEGTSLGIAALMRNFFKSGSMVNFLGAAWFLIVLFITSILSHFFYIVVRKNKYAFGAMTVIVYVFGYYRMRAGYSMPFGIDIAFLAQGYYGIGFLLKSILPDISLKADEKGLQKAGLLLLITSLLMYFMKKYLNGLNIMNLSDRQINSLGWTTFAVLNGIIWLYALSQIVCLIRVKAVKKGLIEIGKNTMGIMLLHFFFFRITAVLLLAFHIVDTAELKNLVPSTEIGNSFWWLYVIIAVTGSLAVWKLMIHIPVLRQLLGSDARFINGLLEIKPVRRGRELFVKVKKPLISFGVIVMILFCGRYVSDNYVKTKEVKGPIQITFPYKENSVDFRDGWLEQEKDENYRWVRKESYFAVSLTDQTQIHLSGYVPADTNVSRVDVYLNNIYVTGADIKGEEAIDLEGSISEAIQDGLDVFEIVFDGEKIPASTDADQRSFSAMFTELQID